ncbi:MAG: hypothetical protein KAT91_00180 [Candidatus Aenigmarchaeota archaeon]|nr:hypothetical protein [Candidatus Aenigmarchaeota archaeon]
MITEKMTYSPHSEKNERYLWLEEHNINADNYLKSLGHDRIPPIDTMNEAYKIAKEIGIKEEDIEKFPAFLSYAKQRIEGHIELLINTLGSDRNILKNPKVFGPSEDYIKDRYNLIVNELELDKKIMNHSNMYELSDDNIRNTFKVVVTKLGLDKNILEHTTIFDLSEKNITDTVYFFRHTVGWDNAQIEARPIYITLSVKRMKYAYGSMTKDLRFKPDTLDLDKLFFESSELRILDTKKFLETVYTKINTIPPSIDYNENPNILLLSHKESKQMKTSYRLMTKTLGFDPNNLELDRLFFKSSESKILTNKKRLDELYPTFGTIPTNIDYNKNPNILLLKTPTFGKIINEELRKIT